MNYIEELKNYNGDKLEKFKSFPSNGRAEIIFELLNVLGQYLKASDSSKAEKILTRIEYFLEDKGLTTEIKKQFTTSN